MKGTGTRKYAHLATSRPTGRGTFLRKTVTGDLREQLVVIKEQFSHTYGYFHGMIFGVIKCCQQISRFTPQMG